jgi:hypothetical protein
VSERDSLVAFLRARLDEDEELAAGARVVPDRNQPNITLDQWWTWTVGGLMRRGFSYAEASFTVCQTPTRVLAEVEAKRRIVDGLAGADPEAGYISATFTAEDALHLLALPHASHPDYRTEWRP